MTVDDAHALIRNVLEGADEGTPGLHDLRLADLNDTEREHAIRALRDLYKLDEALAERSEHQRADVPWAEGLGGDD